MVIEIPLLTLNYWFIEQWPHDEGLFQIQRIIDLYLRDAIRQFRAGTGWADDVYQKVDEIVRITHPHKQARYIDWNPADLPDENDIDDIAFAISREDAAEVRRLVQPIGYRLLMLF